MRNTRNNNKFGSDVEGLWPIAIILYLGKIRKEEEKRSRKVETKRKMRKNIEK